MFSKESSILPSMIISSTLKETPLAISNSSSLLKQPEVFNQNFERRPHMHSFHMV
jgi:hypothetical protein